MVKTIMDKAQLNRKV